MHASSSKPRFASELLLLAGLLCACAGQLDDPERFAGSPALAGSAGASGQAGEAGQAGAGQAGQAGSAGAAGQAVLPGGPLDLTGADVARGKTQAALCAGCHGDDMSGRSIGPWAPNLTPDMATGLGSWSPGQIRDALRTGLRPDGSLLCTSMPRFSEAKLPEPSVADLVAYLRSLPAAASPSPGDSCQ